MADIGKYLVRRLLAIIPTLLGITLITFAIINLAPGSPIDQKISQMKFGGGMGDAGGEGGGKDSAISKELIEELKKQYGFDKPIHIRYWIWLKNLARFDFGESFSYEEPVLDVIFSKVPISLQFGVISLILSYLICIPLGIFKAVKQGSSFDLTSTVILSVMYSIPAFALGIAMIVFLAGGSFLDLFPIGGIYSDNYEYLGFWGKVWDRVYHALLPLACFMIGSFTTLTLLMKNSLLDVLGLDYIRTAKAKGLEEKTIVFKHALRNALIPIVTGIGSFIMVFFTGSILIEQIFQIDGMGMLSYNAMLERDYNILMGLIFIQSVFMMIGNIISDIAYLVVDPRIDFQ